MEEEEGVPLAGSITAPPFSAQKPPVFTEEMDPTAEAQFSLMQKGLFFVVILGCVVVFIRLTSRKEKRLAEKSMA